MNTMYRKMCWWNNKLLTDYLPYYRTKERVFQHLIREEGIVSKWISGSENPAVVPFVGFAGAFTVMLETPFAVNDYIMHFWKEKGLIYCKKGMIHPPHVPTVSGGPPASASTARTNEQFKKSANQYMRLNFTRQLLFPGDHARLMNEDEKFFKISKVNLASHTIITMSELNAVDKEGEDVKILLANWNPKHQKDRFFASRYLEIWSHSQLVNQTKIIIGLTEPYSCNLSEVRIVRGESDDLVNEMERELVPRTVDGLGNGQRDPTYDRAQWSPRMATNFMNRFLSYVQDIMARQEDGRVLTFRYNKMRSNSLSPVIESYERSEDIRNDRLYLQI